MLGSWKLGTRVSRYKLALLFRYELCIPLPLYVFSRRAPGGWSEGVKIKGGDSITITHKNARATFANS